MTGRKNYFLPSSKPRQLQESEPRTAFLNAQALRKSLAKLEGYVATRPAMEREGDLSIFTSNEWMA